MTRATASAGTALAALVLGAALLAWGEGSPLVPRDGGTASDGEAPLFLVLLAIAYAVYLGGLWIVRRGPRLAVVLAVAAAVQLAPLAAPLLLSTDAWTYWGYGWIAREGDSPYRDPPSSHPESPASSSVGADWRDTTSAYGPVFTLASEQVARVADGSPDAAAWLFKSLAAVAMLAATLIVARTTRRGGTNAALIGWNPVLAIHAAGGGHNDAWVGALLVAALALERLARPRRAGVAWATAILVKWVPLPFLLLGLLSPRTRSRGALALGTGSALVVLASLATWRYGTSWTGAAGPLSDDAARATRFALPSRLEQSGVPHTLALVAAGTALLALLVVLARQALAGRPRPAAAACALLLTTPYLAVWYLLWAVPLAAVEEDDRAARVWCLALGAYLLPQTIPL